MCSHSSLDKNSEIWYPCIILDIEKQTKFDLTHCVLKKIDANHATSIEVKWLKHDVFSLDFDIPIVI